MLGLLQSLGAKVTDIIITIGRASLMLFATLARWPKPIKTFPLLIEQLFSVGVLSMVIIVVSGTFIGMVVALQSYHTLSQFGAESQLGPLLALSVIRELGPVVTGLLFAGRACSSLTAEIGLMKATDQLDSMEMIGVDPLWRIISPRFWAGIISMPLLALVFSACAIWGGYLVGVDWLGTDGGSFWANMQSSVDFHEDILNSIIKSVAFGIVATWIAVYQGYDCKPTAEGIGRATTRTVVYGSLAVLGLDFILTTLMIGVW